MENKVDSKELMDLLNDKMVLEPIESKPGVYEVFYKIKISEMLSFITKEKEEYLTFQIKGKDLISLLNSKQDTNV